MSEIDIKGFSGANNVKNDEGFFAKGDIAEPSVILNADVDSIGRLTARKGKVLYTLLPGAHSLWAGTLCMLAVADGKLYRIENAVATEIASVAGPSCPLDYVEAEDKVYMSNQYWQGVFDASSNTVSAWGVPLPPGPMLLAGNGNLPAGTYNVTMTNVSNGELSGNGTISSITLTATEGIQILNRPADALVWITDANEYIFYLVGEVDTIVDVSSIEPLPSFLCSPPPFIENLCYAFGRIWGSSGPNVYYSLPFHLGWFKLDSNVYSFEDPITMIAKTPTGLFIGMEHRTRFLSGTIPEQMTIMDAGAGSIKGTLAYCNNMPELGWTLGTPEKDFTDVPVWVTTEGIVVGNPDGHLFNISKNKIKMAIPARGASLYRNREGIIQFLTSFKAGATGTGAGFRHEDTYDAVKNGDLDRHEEFFSGMGSRASFTEEVTCTVTHP